MLRNRRCKIGPDAPQPSDTQGGIELNDQQPLSRLRSGFAKESKITAFTKQNQKMRLDSDDVENNKKVQSAYQNKPKKCVQLRDQLQIRFKHLVRNSCCVLTASAIILLITAMLYGASRAKNVQVSLEVSLDMLRHPLYQTAYLNTEKDTFYGDYATTLQQAEELESFMRFANYTNYDKKTGRKIMVNGTETDERVPAYDPSTDKLGPGFWLPMQCGSNVTYKYASPLIGLVKRGTQLEKDLFVQIKSIFANMQAVSTFTDEMKKFFDKVGKAFGKKEDEDEPEEEEEEEEEKKKKGSGPAPNPHPVIIENLGKFIYREFESEAELFAYVEQDGYGWEPEKPAICFALQVHENEAKDKYELQLYFRDQWPRMYNTIDRLDSDPAPVKGLPNVLAYTRQAFNGLNNMQIFAANSILQRKLGPEAEIIMMTLPFKLKPFVVDSYMVFVAAFLSFCLDIALLPIIFYLAIALAREKEAGFAQRLFDNGLSRFVHFLSWFIYFTVFNLLFTFCWTVALRQSIFDKDQYGMVFLLFFLALESLFSFMWALRYFSSTTRMAMIVTGFAVFLSYQISFASDQLEGVLDFKLKNSFARSPLTAIKNTFDTYGKLHTTNFPMNYDNWDVQMDNWSLKAGASAAFTNIIFYLVIALVLDLLTNAVRYFGKPYLTRSVHFENTNKGILIISDLQARNGSSPVYNLTVEKSQICCLIGTDSAQKTQLLEMVAGLVDSKGSMVIKDSDFFARDKNPQLNEYLVYHSQNVVLDEDLRAADHLNMFAHLRGNQKFTNMQYLCDRLLPGKTRVKEYSDSQRQTLHTLIALCSANSRICLLDEPTRGLGAVARGEIIKALQRFKKERYLIIQSSDTELVNILADSVAKVLKTGVEMIEEEINPDLATYRLIVQVEDGKPKYSLISCLSKDVTELTLEYHTDQLTYYILPNISRQTLLQKTHYLESNMAELGLIDFEFATLSVYEVTQRDLHKQPVAANNGCERSFEDDEVDYQAPKPVRQMLNTIPESAASHNSAPAPSSDSNRNMLTAKVGVAPHIDKERSEIQIIQNISDENVECNVNSHDPKTKGADKADNRLPPIGMSYIHADQNYAQVHPEELYQDKESDSSGLEPVASRTIITEPEPPFYIREGGEMKDSLDLNSEPVKKPTYQRDYFYDFKQHKTKRTFGPLQCPALCRIHIKEHWHNKRRCLALFFLPMLYVYLSWHCVRYYKQQSADSLKLSPSILPHKQPILVNARTQIGDKDTRRWIARLPMAAEAFETTYVDTSEDKDYRGFEDALLDFSINTATEAPWAQGAYQFFEMDEDRHKYKILSYSNLTAPFSTSLFPQFVIESVMKTALDDDEFEFRTTVTPLPITKEIRDKGAFLPFDDHMYHSDMRSMGQVVNKSALISWEPVGCIAAAWFMLNALTLISLIRERTSERKRFLESHGQSKCSYWLARYVHDLFFYLPVSIVAVKMIQRFEPQMEAAPSSIMIQPFAILPFLYVISYWFRSELRAVLSILAYQILAQWLLPYLIFQVRKSAEVFGDGLFRLAKILPMESSISSMLFNSKILGALGSIREYKETGNDIETDEIHASNARMDVQWMLIHTVFFWIVLMVIIEWRLPCCCCERMNSINQYDDEMFFKNDEDFNNYSDGGESSEVAQILGEGTDFEVRFSIKQKPRKQLAYLFKNYRLNKPRVSCCKRRECLIKELSTQVQAGSKYAIVADGAHGKTAIINQLTNRDSVFDQAAGLIKKQVGRRTPIYTTQSFEVLFADLPLRDNIAHFVSLGSVNPKLANQMLMAFGLDSRQYTLVKDLNASEKHILMLIVALTGSNRTVILDEPFSGLSHQQTIKLVKIMRQKYDCTLIVTAKTKAQLDLLQPQQVLQLQSPNHPEDQEVNERPNYLLAVRIKQQKLDEQVQAEELSPGDASGIAEDSQLLTSMTGQELHQFIDQNFIVFDKLRGKKCSLVTQVIQKLMARARIYGEVAQEIGEMVYEDLNFQSSSQEITIKCELIMQLYKLIDVLCKRFGEVHLENCQDDYAVIRIVPTEYRKKTSGDSFFDPNQISSFSSILEFLDQNDVMADCTSSCQFLSSRNVIRPNNRTGSYKVKTFQFSTRLHGVELLRSVSRQATSLNFQPSLRGSSQGRNNEGGRGSITSQWSISNTK